MLIDGSSPAKRFALNCRSLELSRGRRQYHGSMEQDSGRKKDKCTDESNSSRPLPAGTGCPLPRYLRSTSIEARGVPNEAAATRDRYTRLPKAN